MAGSGGPLVHEELNEQLRQALRGFMKDRQLNQEQIAEELQIKQQTISSFINRRTGASLALAVNIAQVCNLSFDALIGGMAGRLGDLPGWREGESAARETFPHIPDIAFRSVASWSARTPPPAITAAVVGGLAEAWWKGELAAKARSAVRERVEG